VAARPGEVAMTVTLLRCADLDVGHGGVPALTGICMEVAAGETVAVLGASGSGKTTLLHTVAGFLPLIGGEIRMDGRMVAGPGVHLPPEGRRVGYVFQNYALWPHLSVLDNVAYPLRRNGFGRDAAREEASRLLGRLRLSALAARHPGALSGGEQQRVGLARALARRAGLYLFDEPTAHLDAPLRADLVAEIGRHRRADAAAALFATHDAAEALAIADTVMVLDGGRVAQAGSAQEVYERPVSAAVARLTGPASFVPRDRRLIMIRPEWVRLGDGPDDAVVTAVHYRGSFTDYALTTAAGDLLARRPGPALLLAGGSTRYQVLRSHPLADPRGPVE
jgi:ABC-type Fe3+/spermidine/putrescine transport system ATPase subunit